MAMMDMKMATKNDGTPPPAEIRGKPEYPKIYLPTPKGMKLSGFEPGQKVKIEMECEICSITQRDEANYNGSLGELNLEVMKASVKAAGNEFAELVEDD